MNEKERAVNRLSEALIHVMDKYNGYRIFEAGAFSERELKLLGGDYQNDGKQFVPEYIRIETVETLLYGKDK